MTTLHLLRLPIEVRYRIIEFVLPSEYYVSEPVPQPIQSLLLACKTLKTDVEQLLKQWSPILVIIHPRDLTYKLPKAFDSIPLSNFRHHRVAIYHEALLYCRGGGSRFIEPEVGHLCDTGPYDLDDYELLPFERLHAWRYIPREARAIQIADRRVDIDLTLAPGWLRNRYPRWVSAWMEQSRFTPSHHYGSLDFEYIVTGINSIYHSPKFYATGEFLHGSQDVVTPLKNRQFSTSIPVNFDTMVIPSHIQAVENLCIEVIGIEMVNTKLELLSQKGTITWPDRRFWAKVKELVKLTQWDKDTEELFKQRFRKDRQWTLINLEQLLCFIANEAYEMTFEPELRCRRELTIKLAECLEVTPKVKGTGLDKRVTLTRKKSRKRRFDHT